MALALHRRTGHFAIFGQVLEARQPQAQMYFAPSPEALEEMFTRVASDLMVHLVR